MEKDKNGQNNLPPVDNDKDVSDGVDVIDDAECVVETADEGSAEGKATSPTLAKAKTFFSILGTILTILILFLTTFIVVNIIIARVQNKNVSLLGYSFGIVQTPSMEPEIKVGDLIVYKSCDIYEVQVGDKVVFIAGDGFGQIAGHNVIHRVVEVNSSEGIYELTTKGDNNLKEDNDKVTADNFLGICTYYSSFLGGVFSIMSKYGIIIIVALIAVPFIVKQVIKIFKLAREGEGETKQ